MVSSKEGDVENGRFEKEQPLDIDVGVVDENVVHSRDFSSGDSLYARLQRFAGKLGIEQRGIERVPSDERKDASMSKIGTIVSAPSSPQKH